jgi:hypothetical protein
MPRLYAPNEEHSFDMGGVQFINGAAAIASGASTAYFTAEGYGVDTSKHELTLLDKLTATQLRQVAAYLGLTIDQGEDPDTKQVLVRAIETSFSTKYINPLTVTSAAGTASGDSLITITGDVGTTGNTFAYKTHATTAPAVVFRDILPAAGWTAVLSAHDITATTGHKITVVEITTDREIVSAGSATITSKA